jgi:hypothetical protein
MGFSAVKYLDDFGGAEILEHAQKAYEFLGELLNSCGLEESKKKSVEPTNRMTFLGVTFDTVSMTLEVTPERVVEIFEIAPIPNKHASQDNISSGADQFSIDIIEIPLNFDR